MASTRRGVIRVVFTVDPSKAKFVAYSWEVISYRYYCDMVLDVTLIKSLAASFDHHHINHHDDDPINAYPHYFESNM